MPRPHCLSSYFYPLMFYPLLSMFGFFNDRVFYTLLSLSFDPCLYSSFPGSSCSFVSIFMWSEISLISPDDYTSHICYALLVSVVISLFYPKFCCWYILDMVLLISLYILPEKCGAEFCIWCFFSSIAGMLVINNF